MYMYVLLDRIEVLSATRAAKSLVKQDHRYPTAPVLVGRLLQRREQTASSCWGEGVQTLDEGSIDH